MTADFPLKTMEARKNWHTSHLLKEKIANPDTYIQKK